MAKIFNKISSIQSLVFFRVEIIIFPEIVFCVIIYQMLNPSMKVNITKKAVRKYL